MKNMTIQESLDNNPEINPQTKRLQFVTPELPYCEPTSSKVKVEDLITAKQELAQITEREQNEQPLHTGPGQQSFWDRLIPKPQYDWPYDPCMPDEWNEVIASIRTYEGKRTPHIEGYYRQPKDNKVSPSNNFKYRTRTTTDELRGQSSVHLRLEKEDHKKGFPILRAHFKANSK
jgi:hypothetical protein